MEPMEQHKKLQGRTRGRDANDRTACYAQLTLVGTRVRPRRVVVLLHLNLAPSILGRLVTSQSLEVPFGLSSYKLDSQLSACSPSPILRSRNSPNHHLSIRRTSTQSRGHIVIGEIIPSARRAVPGRTKPGVTRLRSSLVSGCLATRRTLH